MKMSLMHKGPAMLALSAGTAIGFLGCSNPSVTTTNEGASDQGGVVSERGEATPNQNARGVRNPHRVDDPFNVTLTGDGELGFWGGSPQYGERIGLAQKTSPQYEPSNQYHDFIGKVLAEEGPGYDAIDPSRAGGFGLTQVSFSLEGADFDPDVSPDGSSIIYSSTQHNMTADLYVKSNKSRVTSQLTNDPAHDVMPKFSPDGGRIAFASNRAGNWDIYVMPTTGGQALQITTESSHELHPSWSPDGKSLTFSRLGEVSGQWEVWVTAVGNPGVSHFLTYGMFPEWCPVAGTGTEGFDRIAFQRSRRRGDRAFSVWTVDFREGNTSNPTEVVQSAYAACINPTWSNDGQWISFATVPNPSQWAKEEDVRPENAELWIVAADGTGLVPLTRGNAINLMPTWGAGDQLYFVSDRGGVDNIWLMNATSAIEAATGVARESGVETAGAPEEN